ncbi:MAG: aspartate aminotransferase family protein [Halieaceae bacterium]|jgi:glutamate-1-semialdehyde 2,1-aminomutase|nr:aspartate aminotransferase family protein [Halieaceae bacterium]
MFPEDSLESSRLYQRALPVMPGGNTRHTVFFTPHPVYIERGEGCRVWDVDGVERIDCINNYSSLIHGHCHPAIVEALREQAGKILSVSLPTEAELRLAELVTQRLPAVDQVRFANSGTEAVMLTVMAARAYTGRNKIAKIEGAYHGSYDAVSVSMYPMPDQWGPDDAPASVPLAGVSQGVCQDTIVLRANDVEGSRAILRKHAADLAGVLVDPMAKNLGFLPLTRPFLQMLREEVDAAGALLMYDEVYSFRMGYNGAQGEVGVLPDLTALGKVIGGGMPVGAIGGRKAIMEALFDPRGPKKMGHGGTFNANPMTMAAGAAALEHYDEAAHQRLAGLGERLRTGLREIFARQGRPATVTGAASMIGLFHTEAPMTDWRASLKAMMEDPGLMQQADTLFRGLLNEGVYMASQGFFVLSTAMTEADIDFVLEKTELILRKLPAKAA